MPSVRELAQEAGVNPNTMQRALSELEREELIYTVRTSGRFVTVDKERICQTREHLAREKIRVLLQDLLKLGFLPDEIMRLVKDTRESMTEE